MAEPRPESYAQAHTLRTWAIRYKDRVFALAELAGSVSTPGVGDIENAHTADERSALDEMAARVTDRAGRGELPRKCATIARRFRRQLLALRRRVRDAPRRALLWTADGTWRVRTGSLADEDARDRAAEQLARYLRPFIQAADERALAPNTPRSSPPLSPPPPAVEVMGALGLTAESTTTIPRKVSYDSTSRGIYIDGEVAAVLNANAGRQVCVLVAVLGAPDGLHGQKALAAKAGGGVSPVSASNAYGKLVDKLPDVFVTEEGIFKLAEGYVAAKR